MLAVADADTCRQCSFAHHEWALAEGISDAELAALDGMNPEFIDPRKAAALYWVHEYASTDFTSVPDVIDANFRQQYAPRNRRTSNWPPDDVLDERDQQRHGCLLVSPQGQARAGRTANKEFQAR